MTEPPAPRAAPLQRLVRVLTDTSERAYRNALGAAFVVLVLAIVVIEAAGPVRCKAYGHDVFLVLDGAWRMIQGQRPHIDFYSPLGALPSAVAVFGLAVGGHRFGSIVHGTALVAFVLGAWTLALARFRLSAVPAALATLVVTFLVLGTHPLGFDVAQTDYAMQYNRYAFAMLAMVWLEAYAPARGRRGEHFGGASTGALVGLLLFLKLNFFGLAAVVGGARLLARGGRRPWLAGAAVGFVATCLPWLVYLRFAVGAMLHDFSVVTQARSQTLGVMRVVDVVGDNGWWVVLLALLVAAVATCRPAAQRSREALLGLVLEASLLTVVDALAVATNWQWLELPVFGMGAIVLLDRAGHTLADADEAERAALVERFAWAAGIAGILAVRVIGRDAWGIATSSLANAFEPVPPDLIFPLDSLSDYVVTTGGGPCGTEYAAKVQDGLTLLDGVVDDHTRLFVADFTNPFNFALKLRSPRGDATWWHYGNTYTEKSPLGPEVVLRDVNLALVPRRCVEDMNTAIAMSRDHVPWLDAHFVPKGQSRYWRLLARP
jgi:hypothetical protein